MTTADLTQTPPRENLDHQAPTAPVAQQPGTTPAEQRQRLRESRVHPERPFGAHLRMTWWRALLVLPALFAVMIGGQVVLLFVAIIVDAVLLGKPIDTSGAMSPTMMLAANLSLALLAPAAIAAMALIGGVPWRAVLRNLPRPRLKRWLLYPCIFLGLILITFVLLSLIEPTPMTFTWNTGVLLFLALALFTTPFQALGEELMFRGAVLPVVASWIRPVVPALIVGVVASSVLFGAVHGARDPWLVAYYTIFGACMALMAIISRGLEAPIAFHVVNNVVFMASSALMGGGEDLVIDRSAGAGGPWVLLMIGLDVVAVGIVWLLERRARRVSASGTAS